MKKYLEILQTQPILKRLSLIQLITYFGAWFSNVAIYTLLIKLNVDASVIAFVAMLHFLSGTIQAPISGAIIDRIEPKKLLSTLIIIQIISTFLLLSINSKDQLYWLYFLIFIKMAAASFYFTAEMSLLPRILKKEILQFANELHSIIWSFSYTLGMAMSGYFVYLFGIQTAFIIDSFFFIVSYFILKQTPIEVTLSNKTTPLFQMIKEAFFYLKKDSLILHLMLLHAFVGFSAFDALVALLVDNFYNTLIATSLALGLMHSFRALGLVIGPIILGKWINKKRLLFLFIFEASAIMLWSSIIQNFYFSLIVSILVGFFTTTLWSYTYTLIQKNLNPKFYGRVIAYNDMFFLGTSAFCSYMIGFLAKHNIALGTITALLGMMFLIGGLYYYFIYKNYSLKA